MIIAEPPGFRNNGSQALRRCDAWIIENKGIVKRCQMKTTVGLHNEIVA
jgi:hypothetical protein